MFNIRRDDKPSIECVLGEHFDFFMGQIKNLKDGWERTLNWTLFKLVET